MKITNGTITVNCGEKMPNEFTGIRVDYAGIKDYYKEGMLHRADGCAYNYSDGTGLFFLEGKRYKKEQWFELLSEEEKFEALFNIDEWENIKEPKYK